jgi:phosphoserine phosphatase
MDSTLIQCEVIDEIARRNDVYDAVSKITELAMNGKYDFAESLEKRVSLLSGVKESDLYEIANNLPFTNGLDTLVRYLKENHFKIGILSGGFDFFAKKIMQMYRFDYQYSNRLEIINDKLTGKLTGEIVDKEKKAFYLKKIAEDEQIDLRNTVAVGDGANDLSMLNVSRVGIAFNAKESVTKQAKFFLNSDNISEIIPIIKKELAI